MTEKFPRPLIAITMGDPAGVGPEIILKALAGGAPPKKPRYVVIGDREVLERTGRRPESECPLKPWVPSPRPKPGRGFSLFEASRLPAAQVKPGRPEAMGKSRPGPYPLGAQWALENQVQALVTAPISKEVIQRTDPDLPATPNSSPRWPGPKAVRHDAGRQTTESQPGDHPLFDARDPPA